MQLKVGSTVTLWGNVTTLNLIDARQSALVERNLGYAPGRLARGYVVAVLKVLPLPAFFEFDGTTLRSGGRLGKPADTPEADSARIRVHQTVIDERGVEGYRDLQRRVLANAAIAGPQRLAKVVPATGHSEDLAPSVQYPMGGGGLQWKLLQPGQPFLVAMSVDAKGIATIPQGTFDLGPAAPYDNRARVAQWLQRA